MTEREPPYDKKYIWCDCGRNWKRKGSKQCRQCGIENRPGIARGPAEVVDGKLLSEVLRKWITNWLKERPIRHKATGVNAFQDHGVDFVGPIQYLAAESGMHVRTVGRISNGHTDEISLVTADKLLHAAGLSHLLDTGEIPIKRGKRWSLEQYMEYMRGRGCI